MNSNANQNGAPKGNTPQGCAGCRNFKPAPKRGIEQHSTGVLVAGFGLAVRDAAAALSARGCHDVAAPLAIGAGYLIEVGRRLDAQASVGREPKATGEPPVNGSVDPSPDDSVGSLGMRISGVF